MTFRSPGAPLALATPALLLVLVHAHPVAIALLGALGLAGLVLWARDRLSREPTPHLLAVLCGVLGAVALAGAVLLGGPGATLAKDLETECRRLATGLAAVALLALGAAAFGRHLVAELDPAKLASSELAPAPPPGRLAILTILLLGGLYHAALFLSVPPLVQIDSWCNLWEPPLFTFSGGLPHHPPVYVELVRLATLGSVVDGLRALMAFQHLVALATALLVERSVRRATGSALAGLAAGLAVALDGMLALYAQEVMTEAVAVGLTVATVAGLVEAEDRPAPGAWLVLAGVACALGTLTRQVVQGWFLVLVAWLLFSTPLRPRGRAALALALGVLLPLGAALLHNHVFYGRAALTAALGRSLTHRICRGLPDPHDPAAPPGDPLETARRLVGEHRADLWLGAHNAIREKLGWSDEEIGRAMVKIYLEQIQKYPLAYAKISLQYFLFFVFGNEPLSGAIDFHEQVRPNAPPPWNPLPAAPRPPAALEALGSVALTSRLPVLVLALLAPLVARERARRLALLALLSTGYFFVVPSLVEGDVLRYRLLGTSFLAMGAVIAVHALASRARRRAT